MFRSIRLRALFDAPDAFCSTYEEESRLSEPDWIARLTAPETAQFVAVDLDDNVVGLVVGAPYRGYEQTMGLFGMWVAPEARRKDLGRKLIASVIEWAREQNCIRVVLDVANENQAAIALYHTCGFQPTGRSGTLPSPREHITEHELELML